MRLNELKSIMFKSASSPMKNAGKDAFHNGLVTFLKGKKIDNIYHIYGRVKDKNGTKEYNTHIKIDLQKNRLDEADCSCNDFKEFYSKGYTLMCSHITGTAYKFLDLLSEKSKNEMRKNANKNSVNQKDALRDEVTSKSEYEENMSIIENVKEEGNNKKSIDNNGTRDSSKSENTDIYRLIRKIEKGSVYYEVQASLGKKLIIHPNGLRSFLENIKSKKIKFKFDYIEVVTPIFYKNMPMTFNLKEEGESIILTTQKQLPISLNAKNDVFYFKNELYIPPEKENENYNSLHKRFEVDGKIIYKKSVENYTKLISKLTSISEKINIDESLRSFSTNCLKSEFLIFEERNKVYCHVILNYGYRKINILSKNTSDSYIRDYRKEEKLIMDIEKNNFIKMKNRFRFIGKDEDLFNILSGRSNSINSLGKVILGKGLKDRKIYNSKDIETDLYESDGDYKFAYRIGNLKNDDLNSALQAYNEKNRFYKAKNNNFLDFEDENVKSFFNLIEAVNINYDDKDIKIEKGKALYLYENIIRKKLGIIENSQKLNEMKNKLSDINNKDIKLPDTFNGTLREYQINGFRWFKTLSELGFGGILADEMGLGKTIQTIVFLLSEQNRNTLIVCPTSLIYNWKAEIEKFAPSLKVLIVHGSERIGNIKRTHEYDIVLTTYGTLRADIEYYNNVFFDCFIIDEGQNIKNAATLNTKVIKKIKAETRFALTGTPIENNLTELWSIFDFIMPGYLYSKEKFEDIFIGSKENNLENLKLLIKPFVLRRTKKEVINELPDKMEKKFLVEMTSSQKAVYGSYIIKVRDLVKRNSDKKIEILSYLTKLRQICLDPSLIIDDYDGGSGKLDISLELIKEHIYFKKGKVLLFSQFTSALDKIGECLDKEEIKFFHLDGKTKPKNRIKMVNDFNNSDSVKVFLISLKAGGTGLNLTAANLVIHFDPWWNPAVQDQATDRAHRIGQKQIVEVIKLVAKGTIEEKIILLQENKKELIDKILTGELKDIGIINSIFNSDLI